MLKKEKLQVQRMPPLKGNPFFEKHIKASAILDAFFIFTKCFLIGFLGKQNPWT